MATGMWIQKLLLVETGRREKSNDERPIDKNEMNLSDWKEIETLQKEDRPEQRPVRYLQSTATPRQEW